MLIPNTNVQLKISWIVYDLSRQKMEYICEITNLCPRLRERHQDVLRQKLFKLKQEQGVESEPLFPIIKEEPSSDGEE